MKQLWAGQFSDLLNQMVFNGQQNAKRNPLLPTDYRSCGKTLSQRRKTAAMADWRHETDSSIQILFDSFSEPPPAGMRSAPMHVREMVFRAEPYQVDIQVEAQAEQNRLVVTGQLLDVSQPDIVGAEVQITLSNLRGSAVQTATNKFGEFRGELENSGDLEVSFLPRGVKPIVILLRGALKESSDAKQ